MVRPLTHCSALQRGTVAPITGKTWSCWSGSVEGSQRCSGSWSVSPTNKVWRSLVSSVWEREVFRESTLWIFSVKHGAYWKDEEGLFMKEYSGRTGSNGFKLKMDRFSIKIRKIFFIMMVVRHWNRFPRDVIGADHWKCPSENDSEPCNPEWITCFAGRFHSQLLTIAQKKHKSSHFQGRSPWSCIWTQDCSTMWSASGLPSCSAVWIVSLPFLTGPPYVLRPNYSRVVTWKVLKYENWEDGCDQFFLATVVLSCLFSCHTCILRA